MVDVSKESGRSFCTLTPASVAVYAMAVCMIKCEVRTFMQMDSAYTVELQAFVRLVLHSRTYLKLGLLEGKLTISPLAIISSSILGFHIGPSSILSTNVNPVIFILGLECSPSFNTAVKSSI